MKYLIHHYAKALMANDAVRLSLFAVAAFGLAMLPADAWAQQGLDGVGQRLRTGLSTFPQVFAIVAQIAGFYFATMGAVALRRAGAEDDRNPQEMKKAMFNIIAGVAAVGIPAMLGMGAHTFFGGTSNVLGSENPTIRIN